MARIESENEGCGFYGAMQDAGRDAAAEFDSAASRLMALYGTSEERAVECLDSPYGRDVADQVVSGVALDEALKVFQGEERVARIEGKLKAMYRPGIVYAWQSASFNRLFVKYAKVVYPGRRPKFAFEDWAASLR